MKSRLTRKRVLNSPKFVLTRMHANQLAEASRIASLIYRQIPKEKRSIKLFRSIVGKAKGLLAEGKEKEIVLDLLMQQLFPEKACKAKERKIVKRGKENIRLKTASLDTVVAPYGALTNEYLYNNE